MSEKDLNNEIEINKKERLNELRNCIDEIDAQLIPLFAKRMGVSLEVAELKMESGASVRDDLRERQVMDHAVSLANRELKSEIVLLMRTILASSRRRQHTRMSSGKTRMLPPARKTVRQNAVCAFQGVPGAWSEQALIKLFPEAPRLAVEFFEDVFLAVKEGRVDYGVVPIENSQTGAIGEIYDLLRKYGCFIVGRTWLDIRQCLLAPPGTTLAGIREVFSHPEGFKQCRRFLHDRAWGLIACRNTAVAAETAAEANDGKTAAIGSRRAAELNGLEVLAPDIMDSEENRTAFVVIAAEPEYDESSDLVAITFSTEHRAGTLCEALMPFMAQGINLLRIESRPDLASGHSEAGLSLYCFFAEIEGNIWDPEILSALERASVVCERFEVLGCYRNT